MRSLSLALVVVAAALAAGCSRDEGAGSGSGSPSVSRLNGLRRGELSAIETYRQALAKEGASAELADIQRDHEDAARRLADRIETLGGTPAPSAGAWGEFAKALEGTAKVLGNKAALQALDQGEKHGVSVYESALGDAALDATSKELIRDTLLPRQKAHVDKVKALIDAKQ